MIKLADYVFQFLKEKGVHHVFMLPGGGAMHLVDSLGNSGLEYICCLHEQAAAIAAEAYGQHSNEIGVILTTSGPGATNAVTGVTAGWIDSTPMFVVSGQAKRTDLIGTSGVRQIGSQEVQIIEMVKPITKYAVQIMEPNEIRLHLEHAYLEATTGRPGPVWLSIPLDVQDALIDPDNLEGYHPPELPKPDLHKELDAVISLLRESQKPLFLAGNGIKLAGGEPELYALLDHLSLPVQTTWKTIDLFGEDHPLYTGHPGSMGDRGANLILQEADLLISVGSRLDTSLTAFNEPHFGKNAKKVVIDIDKYELARMNLCHTEIKLACDAKLFLGCLFQRCLDESREVPQAAWKQWLEECQKKRAQYPVITQAHRETTSTVSAYHFIEVLCQSLCPEDVIVPESSGGAGEITYQAFQIKYGQKMKNAAGLGSMGFGLPYAIGSCIANGRKRTILINGDGAFQLNIQELETIVRMKLPIKIFVWNNDGYASIRAMQKNTFNGHYVASGKSSGLELPELCRIAEAYDIPAFVAKNNEEMRQIVPSVLTLPGPVFCELITSPQETVSPRTKSYRLPDGTMQSSLLEEMWPLIAIGESI